MQTVERVKGTLNPELVIHGIVLTMYDSRNNLANQVVSDVRAFKGAKVYDTVIPRNVRVSEAPSYGKPVLVYDLKCVGSEAYLRLATEIIQREKELLADVARRDGERKRKWPVDRLVNSTMSPEDRSERIGCRIVRRTMVPIHADIMNGLTAVPNASSACVIKSAVKGLPRPTLRPARTRTRVTASAACRGCAPCR